MFRWIKNLFRKRKKPATVYRDRGVKKAPRVMHPLAKFKEDMAMLKANFSFKFDKNHYFILHYTAGRVERRPRDFIKSFLDRGLCTFFIDGAGVIWQQHHGDKTGYHVGKNKWNGKNIGKRAAGVEVANSGKLELVNGEFKTWYGEVIPSGQVRTITQAMVDAGDYLCTGHFRKYKPQQEKSIAHLMAWHVAKGVPKSNLLGHDMVAYPRGRKADHGGSLSMSLEKFINQEVLPLVEDYKRESI